MVATIKVIDAVLKTDTPTGPTWYRYNHDGYGQQHDVGPVHSVCVGLVWPLLTGEHGLYELAASRSSETYIRTMEVLPRRPARFPSCPGASPTGQRFACGSASPLARLCR